MRKKSQKEFEDDVKKANPQIDILGEYVNNATRISVKCTKCGREWDAVPTVITIPYSCPLCEKQKEFNSFLKSHGLVSMSAYKDNFTRVGIKCTVCDYEWDAVPKTLKRDYRCPVCYKKGKPKKWTEESFPIEMKRISPNIELIESYNGYEEKLHCRCRICSYDFYQSPHQLLNAKGCPRCNGHHTWSEEEFVTRLKEVNPTIIVSGFSGIRKKIKCKCVVCNYEWFPQADDVLRGHGCARCIGRERLDFASFVNDFSLKQDNIEILGEIILDTKTMFNCRCKRCGNIWSTNVNRLRQGNGCNLCNHSATSFMEQALLRSFSIRLGDKSVLSRDKTIIGKELDIIIPSKKIAFEPGGWFFHKNSKKKDLIKRQLCKEKNIRLITIYDSYKEDKPPYEEDCFVFREELGAPKNREILKSLIDSLFYICDISPCLSSNEWNEVQKYASEKSMHQTSEEILKDIKKVNSDVILLEKPTRAHEKILCECKRCGWQWESTPIKLKRGGGCPECAGTRKLTQDEFNEQLDGTNPNVIALEPYVNMNHPIEYHCNICGYEWKSKPRALIRQGGICPVCRKSERLVGTLENRGVAVTESHKAIILKFAYYNPSSQYNTVEFKWLIDMVNPQVEVIGEYVKIDNNILCRCRECGNEWKPRAQHILNGHGCPICNK